LRKWGVSGYRARRGRSLRVLRSRCREDPGRTASINIPCGPPARRMREPAFTVHRSESVGH
jgi:hypothetical protein